MEEYTSQEQTALKSSPLFNHGDEEMQYLPCFQALASIFNSQDYEIWIKREETM